ncbi:MAG: hypothetical protein HC924_13405 [Synechococcaceae cyanobacterium SM2_3_2]|nr:hypothetical protein [Synechococcaceae cyanobacterium SM2_3_2]
MPAKDTDGKAIGKYFRLSDLRSPRPPGDFPVALNCNIYTPKRGYWKTGEIGFNKLIKADRVYGSASTLNYVRFIDDYPVFQLIMFGQI